MSDGERVILAALALALVLVLMWAYSKTKESFGTAPQVGFGAATRARVLEGCAAWPGRAARVPTAGSFSRRNPHPLEEGTWMASEDDVVPAPSFLRPDQTPTRFVDAGEDGLGPEGPTLRGRRPFSIAVPDHSPLEN